LVTASITCFGQSYFANGNARSLGGSCYQLTAASNGQLGSVWYADKLDLSKDFDLEFELNFGNKDQGADGIVFVLQTVGNKALGQQGGGIGFEGFSPSFGIEFDTYQNTSLGDPSSDHIAIIKNGSVTHTGINSLAPPVAALAGGGNIEDGQNHLVRITWDAAKSLIQVRFDCVLRQSAIINIPASIFNGSNQVFWGFTSATGGSNNTHIACLRDDIIVQDTFALCKGETILLNARESKNDTYKWTPSQFLDNDAIKNPRCSAITPQTYYVEYTDRCDNLLIDTVHVEIDQPFIMDVAQDSLLCNGARYELRLANDYDSVHWQNGNTSKNITWSEAGYYTIRAWKGVCYDDDSFNITTSKQPQIAITGVTEFCEGDSTLLKLVISPSDVAFTWKNGSRDSAQYFFNTQQVSASGSNGCGSATGVYRIEEIIVPKPQLGRDTILCDGDELVLNPNVTGNFSYIWSTGDTTRILSISKEGTFSLAIGGKELCYNYDTIFVVGVTPPQLGNLQDVILCKKESIAISIDNKHGTVLWNDTYTSEVFTLFDYNGSLSVKSTNGCGTDSKTIDVSLIECYCDMYFPNAFTPNNDILNQTFKAIPNCDKLASYELMVYNRWGEKMFQTVDIAKAWDGYYKGNEAQEGIYFWVADWRGMENGQVTRKTDKGIIHLLR
jgi:gliding motility-associated-like protein